MARSKFKFLIFCFALFVPVLLFFLFIKPPWMARLAAQFFASVFVAFLALEYGINPKSQIIGSFSRSSVNRSAQDKRILTITLRIGIIGLGLGWMCIFAYPTSYDLFQVARRGESCLSKIRGRVVETHSLYGWFCLEQQVSFVREGGFNEENHSAFFLPRIARRGSTYMFTIAPKSGLILDEVREPEPPIDAVDRIKTAKQ
jgi:hypothetical protein